MNQTYSTPMSLAVGRASSNGIWELVDEHGGAEPVGGCIRAWSSGYLRACVWARAPGLFVPPAALGAQ